MKVLLRILLLFALVVYLAFAVTKFNNPEEVKKCTAVNIVVEDSAKAVFITPKEIRNILSVSKVYPLGKKINDVNCYEMEKSLMKNPFIDKAMCYKTAGGQIVVRVNQRLPVMRIISDSGENYFIDSQGKIMPHMHYTADMVVATGNISHSYANKNLIPIGTLLQEDEFWNGQIEQIHVDGDENMEIIPRVGEHVVYIGEPVDIPQKFQRLKAFYEKVLCKVGWNKYSHINIEYSNQIICRK